MGIVAEEIAGKQFIVGLRGYDRDEVQAFLRAVAEEVRRLHVELQTARIPSPDSPEALGTQVAAVMRAAQDQARELREAAIVEADALRAEAEAAKAEATRVLEEAQAEAAALLDEARTRGADVEAAALSRTEKAMSLATDRFRMIRTAELEVAHRIEESRGLLDAVREELAADDLLSLLEGDGQVVADVTPPVEAAQPDTTTEEPLRLSARSA
ncbi:MAG TPA: DivIVA domain-containing protein [Acidimicrobiales bacterium]|nr:DivIVA domain-containing protein [Acidimicrobiales bacterium]